MFGLKKLTEVPTRVPCTSSTIIDHILASISNRVSKQGVIDVGLSDHQIIYFKIKRSKHKQITCCSLKFYLADIYQETLGSWDFQNQRNFENINEAHSNFMQKIMKVIYLVAPIKSRRMKQNSQE